MRGIATSHAHRDRRPPTQLEILCRAASAVDAVVHRLPDLQGTDVGPRPSGVADEINVQPVGWSP